jgi:hypothetical protein
MTALGEVGTVTEVTPNAGVKVLSVKFPDTVIGGTDTVQVDLNDYGCTKLDGILLFDQTTTGSVVVLEAATTVVSSGVLVIDLGGSDTGVKTAILYCS